MKETVIHLIRHGETEWNKERRVQGNTDIPLSREGREQSRQLAAEIRGMQIDRVYTSCLMRAIETAAIAFDGLGVPIHRHEGLNERRYGEYEGRIVEEIEAEFGEGSLRHRTPENGESLAEFVGRVKNTLGEIVDNHVGENVAIVSHGGVIGNLTILLSEQLGVKDEAGWNIANCSVATFQIPTEFGIRGSK